MLVVNVFSYVHHDLHYFYYVCKALPFSFGSKELVRQKRLFYVYTIHLVVCIYVKKTIFISHIVPQINPYRGGGGGGIKV